MRLTIKPSVIQKLNQKHSISENEVEECFFNRTHGFLTDIRQEHKTDPPTNWFISESDKGRKIKICFIRLGNEIILKTAYEISNKDVINMYYRKAIEE